MQHELRALEALAMFSRPARRWQRGTAAICVAKTIEVRLTGAGKAGKASAAAARTTATTRRPGAKR
jgi:hypothetical protein